MRYASCWRVLVLVMAAWSPAVDAADLGPIGVLGDSYSDEYQFEPPDRSTARNWLEILAATRGLDFGGFTNESRGEPRRQGFEFNWARSDATSTDLVAGGQLAGLAGQAARGEVRIALVFVGGNDFLAAVHDPDPYAAIPLALERALANYQLIVTTLRGASPDLRLVLVTVPDLRYLPDIEREVHEGRISKAQAKACSAAIASYNAAIRAHVRSDHARSMLIDFARSSQILTALSPGSVPFGRRWLDRMHPGNEIGQLFLADERHPGTLANGLFARMFLDCVNDHLDAGIRPLEFAEIESVARACGGPDRREQVGALGSAR